MQLHFILLIKEGQLGERREEFEYVKRMAQFFKTWIKKKFGRDYQVSADIMTVGQRRFFERLDTHVLVDDHRRRGADVYHFYLAHFHPFWTDCTCEGYHAENFGMISWQRPENDDMLFMAEKNCATVSHEIAHEMLRQDGVKKFIQAVHDVWMQHFHNGLEFEQYGADFEPTKQLPHFLTIDTSQLALYY